MFVKATISFYYDRATIENINAKIFKDDEEFYDFCLDNMGSKINAVANKNELYDLIEIEKWNPMTGEKVQ